MFDLKRIAGSGLIEQIDFHEELGSTNDRALAIGASDEIRLPLLVLTGRQTAGRGRGANRWLTTDGALTFSLVLEAPVERLPLRNRPQVALAAGVAVAEALSGYAPGAAVQVKWPNDVFLNGSKIGGILSESIPGWGDRFVVGIGVNVNNRVQGSGFRVQSSEDRGQGTGDSDGGQGSELRMATSLVEHDGMERDVTSVLVGVLDEFDRRWNELLDSGFEAVGEIYRERCLLTGKIVTVGQHDGRQIAGMCRGIDGFGALTLVTANGEQKVISGSVVGWEG